MRVFNGEYMIAQTYRAPVISNLTLALLHDSGHYFPNYSAAETLLFGKSKGCGFPAPGKCVENWPKYEDGYICEMSSAIRLGCASDRRSKVWCNGAIGELSQLPLQFQYFSDPNRGGGNILMDYCPIANSKLWCLWPSVAPETLFDYGEQYCENCRCFLSSLIESVPGRENFMPSCHKQICISPNELRIEIEGYYYNCPFGGYLQAENFGGKIICPTSNDSCSSGPYHEDWPNFISIFPAYAKPSDVVTITGNFLFFYFFYCLKLIIVFFYKVKISFLILK